MGFLDLFWLVGMWQDALFRKLWAPCPLWIWAVFKVSALAPLGELITQTQA